MSDPHEMVTVPKDAALAVLEALATSMDFGSGFLDDDEVEALRTFAAHVGVDPTDVTPDNHLCKYQGFHMVYPGGMRQHCYRCNSPLRPDERAQVHIRLAGVTVQYGVPMPEGRKARAWTRVGHPNEVSVEVSDDGGKTWREVARRG